MFCRQVPVINAIVILGEVKDLLSLALKEKQVLRFAQDDNLNVGHELAFRYNSPGPIP